MPITVFSYGMATPKCFQVIVRDGAITRQSPRLVHLDTPSTADYSDVTTEYEGLPGSLIGPDKQDILLLDTKSDAFLERDDADDLANYVAVDFGDATCTAITRRSYPIDMGTFHVSGDTTGPAVRFEHAIRYQLDAALAVGTEITVTPPNSAFPTVNETFDDETWVSPAIHANTLGHGPFDAAKLAYLSFWNNGAGTEGIEDFINDHDVTEFHVVDETNAIVDTFPVTLRHDETDTENSGNSYGALKDSGTSLGRLISTTHSFTITAITNASPAVVTAPGHDFENDDIVHVLYAVGMNEVNFYSTGNRYTVAGVSGDTFQLSGIDSSAYGTYTGEGIVYGENLTNGAGTKTFDLDYAGFEAPTLNKEYRIYIEGLGVSLPFKIDEACYALAARNSIGGLFNLRNGIAKNGEYGYTVPQNLRDGIPTGFHFYDSMVPIHFTGNRNGPLGEAAGSEAAWKVDNIRTDVWGGYQDAGDWDVRMQHITRMSNFLDLWELLPEANFNADLGTPKALDYVDNTFWSGTGSLPSILQEVIFHFDCWRRLRKEAGEVSGGYEFSLGANDVSWLTRSIGTVYFPDPETTFYFAGIAAQLGRIVGEYGLTTLETTLVAMAEESYDRAAVIVADLDTYYADVITIADAEDIWTDTFTEVSFKAAQGTLSTSAKNFAAIHLYRATLEEEYRLLVEASGNPSSGNQQAGFHYIIATDPNKNATTVSTWTSAFTSAADAVLPIAAAYAYENTKSQFSEANFGSALPVGSFVLYRAWKLSGDEDYLRPLYRVANHLLGANPHNMSFIRGIGANQVTEILNVDSRRLGLEAPNGVTFFAYDEWTNWNFNTTFGRGPSFPHTPMTAYRNQFDGSDDYDAEYKMLEPIHAQTPLWEYIVRNSRVVSMMEFSPNNIADQFCLFMFLWGYKNAPSTELGRKRRFTLHTAAA